ncbi:hypothetical protein [Streptomyces griseosporeus]|uniref:hypothetical protein n=1 Tax=Streptomyces griseosporeus TaxID=1910 RepID=UPI0036FDF2AF
MGGQAAQVGFVVDDAVDDRFGRAGAERATAGGGEGQDQPEDEDVLQDCADELGLRGPVLSARATAELLCDALAGIAQARQVAEVKHARLRHLAQLTVRGFTRAPEDASPC